MVQIGEAPAFWQDLRQVFPIVHEQFFAKWSSSGSLFCYWLDNWSIGEHYKSSSLNCLPQ